MMTFFAPKGADTARPRTHLIVITGTGKSIDSLDLIYIAHNHGS